MDQHGPRRRDDTFICQSCSKAEKHADVVFYLLHVATGLALGTYLTSSKAVILHSLMLFPATGLVMSCNVVNYKNLVFFAIMICDPSSAGNCFLNCSLRFHQPTVVGHSRSGL